MLTLFRGHTEVIKLNKQRLMKVYNIFIQGNSKAQKYGNVTSYIALYFYYPQMAMISFESSAPLGHECHQTLPKKGL